MSKYIRDRTKRVVESGQIQELHLDPTDPPTQNTEESILSDSVEPDDDLSDVLKSKERQKTLDKINTFLKERGISDYNQIEGKNFKSTKIPVLDRETVSEDELKFFQNHWNEQSLNDERMVFDYLKKVFGKVLSKDETKLKRLHKVFLHNSWKNTYRPDTLNDYTNDINISLGHYIQEVLIAKSLIEKRLFSEEKIHSYSVSLAYITSNYPCKSVLSDINCLFILHLGGLKKEFERDIYFGLLGALYTNLSYDKFNHFYIKLLNRIDDFIYDDYSSFDYKSILQEYVQKDFGGPKYKLINESGPEHDKKYEMAVFVKEREYGKGIGSSKKQAEIEASYEALKKISESKTISYKTDIKKTTYQDKYAISTKRINNLEILLERLPFNINNIRLLDVALTHPSYINEHREKRSYRKLAFLGSSLDYVLRFTNYFESFDWQIDKETYQLSIKFRGISPSMCFPQWFDKMELEKPLNTVRTIKKPSNRIKTETVQAIVAAIFIDQGFYAAKNFCKILWSEATESLSKKAVFDYVSELQTIVQLMLRSGESHIKYETIRESKVGATKFEQEMSCIVEGKEYGRGKGPNKSIAKQEAAKKTLKNIKFIQKYNMPRTDLT